MDQPDLVVDHFMTVGTNHHVCQDYVISRESDIPRLILSDGCSSSLDTDIGARLWVRSADTDLVEQLAETSHGAFAPFCSNELIVGSEQDLVDLAATIGEKVYKTRDLFILSPSMADCTLLMAYHFGMATRVMMFGDGIFFIKKNGELHIFRIEFSHNAPLYPSYLFDTNRMEEYYKMSKKLDAKVEITYYESGVEAINTRFEDIETWPGYFTEIFEGYECMGIASDGICQIKERGTANFLHIKKVLKDFLAFKGVNGDFVKRRVGRALEGYAKEGYYPSDDLSIAVMLDKKVWDGQNNSTVTGA